MDFNTINKYNVQVLSLKNKLKVASDVEEISCIATRIVELENSIMLERTTRFKILEKEKKEIENRIDKIRRELKRAEDDLRIIDSSITVRIDGYKEKLQEQIEELTREYNFTL